MMMNPTDAARAYHDEPIPPRKDPPTMPDAKRSELLPVLPALLEVVKILTEMIRAEPLYALPGYANGRNRLFPEAFVVDVDAARARLGLPPTRALDTTRQDRHDGAPN